MAPSDPRWRAATVGGFAFGGSDPPYSILAVQAEKDGITTISGELMGKSLSILHIVVNISPPTPYGMSAHCSVQRVVYTCTAFVRPALKSPHGHGHASLSTLRYNSYSKRIPHYGTALVP